MRRSLFSSRCDVIKQVGAGTRQSPSGRRHGASRRALAVLVGCLALFALPSVASALPNTGIKGRVTNSSTHSPIAGVEVCAVSIGGGTERQCGQTSSNGEYEIKELKEEEYRVEFISTQYEQQPHTVEVKAGEIKEVNAELSERTGNISGQVTNASNGQGLGGIEVCANGTEYYERCAETNGNGEYAVYGLSIGTYTVSFSPIRYSLKFSSCEEELEVKVRCTGPNVIGQSVSSVSVKAGETETVNAQLQAGGQISGTVTNASITHPAIAKIEVDATRVNSKGEEECQLEGFEYSCGSYAWTNSSGAYTISGLQSGSYKVSFDGDICTEVANEGRKEAECVPVYIGDYYHEQQTLKKAQTVNVTVGQTTSGINESLREAFPTTPASTAAPTLTGTPAVGKALSCSQGSWSHEPTYLVYQWLRNGTVITGQTGSTYTVQAADQGKSITCVVWAGNGAGAASATSNAVTIPVPLAVFVGVKVKGSVASVTLRCPGPGSCSGVMRLVARVVTKHGKRKKTSKVTIGVASFSMAAGKKATLRVRLTGQGRKLLGKAGKRGLKVTVAGSGVKAHAATLKMAKAGKHKKKK
jgi:hypothetical protein